MKCFVQAFFSLRKCANRVDPDFDREDPDKQGIPFDRVQALAYIRVEAYSGVQKSLGLLVKAVFGSFT